MKRDPEPGAAPPSAGDAQEPEAEGSDLLQILLDEFAPVEAAAEALPERIDGVVVGLLSGISAPAAGELAAPLVTITRGAAPIAARALVALALEDAGREVALLFEGGDPARPMIMGFVQRLAPLASGVVGSADAAPSVMARPAAPEAAPAPEAPPEAIEQPLDVQADGERVVLSAHKEIVLQCGKASITLTRAGKILIRGAYVLTRSSGVNRILGGSVQIN